MRPEKCAHCGMVLPPNNRVWVDNAWYCCWGCATQALQVTTLMRDVAHWRDKAAYDALTGVFSRELLDVNHSVSPGVVVMMIDVDRFKSINDREGHVVGDQVLRTVARRLEHHLRSTDRVIRYGGDEFLVWLSDYAGDECQLADRMREAVERDPIPVKNRSVAVTISLGVARAAVHATLESLLEEADRQLYGAKQRGRNRVGCRLEGVASCH